MRSLILLPLAALLSGCVVATVAETAVDVVTLPVKVVSKTVDLATTSQAEADQKRGRDLRQAEERAGRDARKREEACRKAKARGEACAPDPLAPDPLAPPAPAR